MKSEESPITVIGAIAANLIIAVAKFVAAGFSGSSSMISEGIHSLVDTGNQALMLVGLKRSKRPPDKMHPFGYGKEIYFWTLVVAVLLFGIGGGMSIYEGYHHLVHPGDGEGSLKWSYITLGIAFLAEGTSWYIALRAVRKEGKDGQTFWEQLEENKRPSTFVVFAEDSAALLGIIIAALGISVGALFGSSIPDAIASMIIGLILCATAVFLTLQSKHLMIGESVDPDEVDRIEKNVTAHEGVRLTRSPLTMQMGPDETFVALDIALENPCSSEKLAKLIDQIEADLREEMPTIEKVYVECQLLGESSAPEATANQETREPEAASA